MARAMAYNRGGAKSVVATELGGDAAGANSSISEEWGVIPARVGPPAGENCAKRRSFITPPRA